MRPRLAHYLKNNGVAFLALFVALGGTSAYAVNTINSTDIVDGQVKSVDIANDSIHSGDILDNTINTFDVHSFLGVDVVDGSLTGADLADNSIGVSDIGSQEVASDEVLNNALLSSDISSQAVGGDELTDDSVATVDVQNGSLNDEDISQSAHVNFPVNIGTVQPGDCVHRAVTGLNAQGDHLVLTPNYGDAAWLYLTYTPMYTSTEAIEIVVCNRYAWEVPDGTTHFNLLVIDAQ